MEISDKIPNVLALLLISAIIAFAIVIILSNSAFSQQTLHDRRLSEVARQISRPQEIPQIDVGASPGGIAVNEREDRAYVVKNDLDSVAVISAENNRKIGEDIPVGNRPVAIDVNINENIGNKSEAGVTVYVANYLSNDISVIDGRTNTNIGKNIPVGVNPVDIAVNNVTNTVYVANEGSKGVSVIDGMTNEVVAGVTFHVKPFGSGRISCDDTVNASPDDLIAPSPTEQYIYLLPGTECIAKPNEGFEYVSWEENLEDNSTQLISVSGPASIWDAYLRYRQGQPDEPETKLNITKFGTFTANFKQVSVPIPQEYLILFVSVLLTSIATLVTTWFSSRTKKKRND